MPTRHTKTVGIIAAMFLVVSLGILSGLLYLISATSAKYSAQQTEVAKAQVHQQELSSLARLVEASADERNKLSSYVLSDQDIINFLALLETLAKEQGVTSKIQSLKTTKLNNTFDELTLTVLVRGSYTATLRMLTLLETLPYQSYVEKVDVSRDSSALGGWTGTFLLHVVKYKGTDS
jgi:hypothetical protein